MSDFIKVNCLNGDVWIAPKKQSLLRCSPACGSGTRDIFSYTNWRYGSTYDLKISKEEYNRLCKELGVSESDCSHNNKNYSALAQTVCATKYRIVFWECEDCGYLEAEQPTRAEVEVEDAV